MDFHLPCALVFFGWAFVMLFLVVLRVGYDCDSVCKFEFLI